MRRWWPLLALLLSLGVNLGLVTALVVDRWKGSPGTEPGGGPGAGPPPRALPALPGPRFERAATMLGLEGENRQRFLEIEHRYFEEARQARQRVQEAREAIRRAILQPEVDVAEVDRLTEVASRLTADQDRAFVRHLVELKPVLAPEQLEHYLVFLTRARAAGVATEGRPPGGRPRLRDRLRPRP